jgi:hypothetical protein
MERKIGKATIMIVLLLMSISLMANTPIVKASGTIYIRADGSIDPQIASIQQNWIAQFSEPPPTQWNKTYGGANGDRAFSVVQTGDGGYVLAGETQSFGAGGADCWLVRTDSAGNMLWNKTYGGASFDAAFSVVQTSDGGYVLAGDTQSFGAGYSDFYLVKTDSAGNMLWNKTYGGTGDDGALSVVQTSDGGYVVAGFTYSFGAGDSDCWLVRTDSAGNMLWNKTYGGTGDDGALSVVQTSDGGYAMAGWTYDFESKSDDCWLVKTDSAGNMLWNRKYGGVKSDVAFSVFQTSDGRYVIAGYTESFGAGYRDFYLVKTDSYGYSSWERTYGGTGDDEAFSFVQTSDGGYAMAGDTRSFGAGEWDFWLVRTDSAGNMIWNKTYGGAGWDLAFSVIQTSDGGYAMAGATYSFGAGIDDFWLVKVAPEVKYNLTITTTTGGTTNPAPGTYTYLSGTVVSVAAIPNIGYTFNHWELDGSNIGVSNPINVTMNTNHLLKAVFERTQGFIDDVAITNISAGKTVVGQGYNMNVNVTVANQGDYTETFNVTLYANTTIIETRELTLTSGNSTTLTFTWNTAGFAKGNYTISAYAEPVPGETDTADNTFTDRIVLVTKKGDINGDDEVNVLDLILVAIHLGHANGDNHIPFSNEWYQCLNTDLNNDNDHNVLDLILVANYLGT